MSTQGEIKRPNPEELLRPIDTQENMSQRGRLKIFLGYAPRVGKSVRMFDEGRRRKLRGQDVVIGSIQAKGSEHVAHIAGQMELVPMLQFPDGVAIDVPGVIKRRPQVCLIDELARENPEGSRNPYRWQDVEEIVARGISVLGALNLQHIAEQQDTVERITGRRASTSVPESFIKQADEIVIVDAPAEQLVQNAPMAGGDLTASKLSDLREIALILAAQVVEEQLQRYMDSHGIKQSWGTQERILVCITPRSGAQAMLESGARAAARFHGQLTAVYVKQGDLTREASKMLEDTMAVARELGAEVHVLDGKDPIAEIIRFSKEQRVTQIFIGHTQQSSWKFWAEDPVDSIIKDAEGMDVRIFPHGQHA